MKTLKESILSRSSHGAKGFDAHRREMIKDWLKKYDIRNYTINDDFTIDVAESIFIEGKQLTEFPEYIQFGVINGYFNCSKNYLISLRGCPREVRGYFSCRGNKLTSLEGAPKEVGNYFNCSNNQLTSLKEAPEKVGSSFYCNYNKLTSLVGAPKEVGGNFMCYSNKLTSLKEAPKKVGKDFICFDNGGVRFTEADVRKVCDVGGEITV